MNRWYGIEPRARCLMKFYSNLRFLNKLFNQGRCNSSLYISWAARISILVAFPLRGSAGKKSSSPQSELNPFEKAYHIPTLCEHSARSRFPAKPTFRTPSPLLSMHKKQTNSNLISHSHFHLVRIIISCISDFESMWSLLFRNLIFWGLRGLGRVLEFNIRNKILATKSPLTNHINETLSSWLDQKSKEVTNCCVTAAERRKVAWSRPIFEPKRKTPGVNPRLNPQSSAFLFQFPLARPNEIVPVADVEFFIGTTRPLWPRYRAREI